MHYGWKNPYISDNATISLQAKLHTKDTFVLLTAHK